MIASVSTFARSSGATRPSLRTNFSMISPALSEAADVDEMPSDRRCRRHRGAHEVGPAAGALPPFEVTVRSRCAALARRQLIVVHSEAHRASGLTPLEASGSEDFVETFLLRL